MHQRVKSQSGQKGVVLIVALIVLVGMTLAAVALVRSVDTGNVVAGNIGFKRGTTQSADAGVEAAVAYLVPLVSGTTLQNDIPAFGYYASSQNALDVTGKGGDAAKTARVDWDDNGCGDYAAASACIAPSDAIIDTQGNSIRYIIHRLCEGAGASDSATNSCVTYTAPGSVSSKRGELKVGDNKRFGSTPTPYYRITVRSKGPRNTVSFIETIVHF
jgi:Tfp pilus assembly protein PilX